MKKLLITLVVSLLFVVGLGPIVADARGRVPSQVLYDDPIRWAQERLRVAGLDPGPIDGRLGPETQAALREYQRTHRLPQTGLLDEATLTSLMPEQPPVSSRPIVLPGWDLIQRAQARLRAAGFDPGPVDGHLRLPDSGGSS